MISYILYKDKLDIVPKVTVVNILSLNQSSMLNEWICTYTMCQESSIEFLV